MKRTGVRCVYLGFDNSDEKNLRTQIVSVRTHGPTTSWTQRSTRLAQGVTHTDSRPKGLHTDLNTCSRLKFQCSLSSQSSSTVVLNLGSIETQGFVESLSGVRQGSRHTQYSPVHTINVGSFLYIPMFWRNHILFFQLRRVRWMHWWSLQGSVPPIRLRTTVLKG